MTITLRYGGSYQEKATGREFFLQGIRSKRRVCLIYDLGGPGQEIIDFLPVDEMSGRFVFLHCNHDYFCCTAHRIHAQPHNGCLMR